MKLAEVWISSSRMDKAKLQKLIRKLKREPLTVLRTSMFSDDPPELYFLSPLMYDMLADLASKAQQMTQAPVYGELRRLIKRKRGEVSSLAKELRRAKTKGYRIRRDFWDSLSNTVLEEIEQKINTSLQDTNLTTRR